MDEKKHVCFLWNLGEFGHEKHKISFYEILLHPAPCSARSSLTILFWHSPHTWICTAEAHPSGWGGGGISAPNVFLPHQVGYSFTYQFLGQLPKSPCHLSQQDKIHCKTTAIVFNIQLKVLELFAGVSKWSSESKSLALSPWQGQTGIRTSFSPLSIQTTRLRVFFCTGPFQVSPCEAVKKIS